MKSNELFLNGDEIVINSLDLKKGEGEIIYKRIIVENEKTFASGLVGQDSQ